MNHPMIAWCVIAGLLLGAFIFRAAVHHFALWQHHGHRSVHILEIGKERDIFYIPGDIDPENDFED